MKCSKCNRPIPLPPALVAAVKQTAKAERQPLRAMRIVCAVCLNKPKEIASEKAD